MKFCGPSIQKEISKQKQKCSYLFVQIKWEEALLRDYVNVINSLSSRVSPQQRPAQRFLNFHVLKKESSFSVFFRVAVVMWLSSNIWCFIDVTFQLLFTIYLKDQHTTGRRAVTRKRQKPALAFENVDFVDDVVIFVIVRINETRKVLYVKVRPRYYINK